MKERKTFQRGVALFNACKFFEAHEAWEELWLLENEPEKTFLQGLIQIAAALHHYRRQNWSGAKSLLDAGTLKLERFPEDHHGLALADFRAQTKRCARMLGAGRDPGARRMPQIHPVHPSSHRKERKGRSARRKKQLARP